MARDAGGARGGRRSRRCRLAPRRRRWLRRGLRRRGRDRAGERPRALPPRERDGHRAPPRRGRGRRVPPRAREQHLGLRPPAATAPRRPTSRRRCPSFPVADAYGRSKQEAERLVLDAHARGTGLGRGRPAAGHVRPARPPVRPPPRSGAGAGRLPADRRREDDPQPRPRGRGRRRGHPRGDDGSGRGARLPPGQRLRRHRRGPGALRRARARAARPGPARPGRGRPCGLPGPRPRAGRGRAPRTSPRTPMGCCRCSPATTRSPRSAPGGTSGGRRSSGPPRVSSRRSGGGGTTVEPRPAAPGARGRDGARHDPRRCPRGLRRRGVPAVGQHGGGGGGRRPAPAAGVLPLLVLGAAGIAGARQGHALRPRTLGAAGACRGGRARGSSGSRRSLTRRRSLRLTVLASSTVGVPPFYLVTLACGTVAVPPGAFLAAAFLGTAVRYAVLSAATVLLRAGA